MVEALVARYTERVYLLELPSLRQMERVTRNCILHFWTYPSDESRHHD